MAAARGAWKDDNDLKNLLEDLVKKGYKRDEILMTVKKTFLNTRGVVSRL